MKFNKKKILIIISFLIVILSTVTFYLYNSVLNNKDLFIAKNRQESEIPSMFAIMMETSESSGTYSEQQLLAWPSSDDYVFNSNLSYCMNGSELLYIPNNNTFSVTASTSDKCYLYFDILLPDFTMAAMTKDGASINSYPAKNNLTTATPTCANCDAKWDYDNWRLQVNNVSGEVSCSLAFTTIANVTLANHIILLRNGVDGTNGIYYTNSHEYRYTGLNPNNYVWYNGELWRIVGVFDSNSHGIAGTNLVKIIRSEPLGVYPFSTDNTNYWINTGGEKGTLNTLLNDYYFSSRDATGESICKGYSTLVPTNCDYTTGGLNTISQSMVQTVTWYLGGEESMSSAQAWYGYERGTKTYAGNALTSSGNVGLMYPSDYGYASGNSCWSVGISMAYGGYNTANCAGTNWLYGKGYEWTISLNSSRSDYVWHVNDNGYLSNDYGTYLGYVARPVLYLKSTINYLSGDGSKVDPFIIGMS